MKLSLSISNSSEYFSKSSAFLCDSPKTQKKDILEELKSNNSDLNEFQSSKLNLKESVFCLEANNLEKFCSKKNDLFDLEPKKVLSEKEENESMLAFQGLLNPKKNNKKDKNSTANEHMNSNLISLKKKKNLIFQHLKKMNFDDDESKMMDNQQKNKDFEMFLKKEKIKSVKQKDRSVTNFNFESMNQKNKNSFNSPSAKTNFNKNFCYKIFNHFRKNQNSHQNQNIFNKSLNQGNHVNLKKISTKSNRISSFYPLTQQRSRGFNERVSITSLGDRKSLKSTGLRRKDVIFGDVKNKNQKNSQPVALVNLASFLNLTPELSRNKESIFGLINQSLKTISMRNIMSPQVRQKVDFSQTSVRKRTKMSVFRDEMFQNMASLKLAKRNSEIFDSDKKNSETVSISQLNSAKKIKKQTTYSKPTTAKKKKSTKLVQSAKKPKKKGKCGCRCQKTKCARLHCICFRERGYCGEECSCTNCFNREEFSEAIKKIRDFTKEINPLAFQSKIESIGLESGQKIHNRGCSCTKNMCMKNYCECHKNGLSCSPLCKCENCKNDKVDIDVSKVKKIFKKCSRKKKKFVIFLNKEKPIIKKIQI